LSGNIAIADSVRHPLITGSANLVDGKFLRGSTVSAGVNFKGRNATIDFVHLEEIPALDVSAKGELDFSDPDYVHLSLLPTGTVFATDLAAGDCVSSIEFLPGAPAILPARQIQELVFSGGIFGRPFTIAFPSAVDVDPPQEFPFCHDSASDSKTLTLRIAPAFSP
jgi:hypothetical protein